MKRERFAALILAICVIYASVYVVFLSYELEQWKSTALEALELNQQFIEANDELLGLLEERNNDD